MTSKYSPESSVSTEKAGNSVSFRFSLADSVGRSGRMKATMVSAKSTAKKGTAMRVRRFASSRRLARGDMCFCSCSWLMRAPQNWK